MTGVAFAGPERIGPNVVLSRLDVALLRVETTNGTDTLPPPLPLSSRLEAASDQSDLYVMGYPARPNNEVGNVLMKVFQDEYFVKRFAPGFVMQGPGSVSDGGHGRVFSHDASTLGGNSGSCIIEFSNEGKAVLGLHFGGAPRAQNYAHSIARIETVLTQHGATLQDLCRRSRCKTHAGDGSDRATRRLLQLAEAWRIRYAARRPARSAMRATGARYTRSRSDTGNAHARPSIDRGPSA